MTGRETRWAVIVMNPMLTDWVLEILDRLRDVLDILQVVLGMLRGTEHSGRCSWLSPVVLGVP